MNRDEAATRGLVPVLVAVTAVVAVLSSLGAPLIPTIAASDHVPLSSAQWVLTIGLLAGAVTTPVLGRLADGPRQCQVVLVTLAVGLGVGLSPVTRPVASWPALTGASGPGRCCRSAR